MERKRERLTWRLRVEKRRVTWGINEGRAVLSCSVVSASLWPHGLYVACQASLSIGISRQSTGLPCPPLGLSTEGLDVRKSRRVHEKVRSTKPLGGYGVLCHIDSYVYSENKMWSCLQRLRTATKILGEWGLQPRFVRCTWFTWPRGNISSYNCK